MNGPLEPLETLDGKSQHRVPGSRALVPKEWCRKETAATYTCMVLGFMDWLRWTANCVIVSFMPGSGISLKAWHKPLVASGTSGLDGCGRWGQGSGQ